MKIDPQVKSVDTALIQLYNFDNLSLDNSVTSTQDDDEYSDVLSSNSIYKLKIKQAAETLQSVNETKPLISIKSKRLAKQKKALIKKI